MGDGGFTAGGALVDVGFAAGDGAGVGEAAGVVALLALGLGEVAVNFFGGDCGGFHGGNDCIMDGLMVTQ